MIDAYVTDFVNFIGVDKIKLIPVLFFVFVIIFTLVDRFIE